MRKQLTVIAAEAREKARAASGRGPSERAANLGALASATCSPEKLSELNAACFARWREFRQAVADEKSSNSDDDGGFGSFADRFGTPSHPEGCPMLIAATLLRYEAALITIRRGDYDNAHDCKAAARIAASVLPNVGDEPRAAKNH